MKKKKHIVTYEFDTQEIKAGWYQIMRENAEGMSVGMKSILEGVGIESDPVIHIKNDKDLILVKLINTDKGEVMVYEDEDKKRLISKPYKLVSDNEVYLAFFGKDLLAFFRRTGGVDLNTAKGFASIDHAVEGLKLIDDPIVVAERIKQRDIEDGIIDKDGNPLPQKVEDETPSLEAAIPKV